MVDVCHSGENKKAWGVFKTPFRSTIQVLFRIALFSAGLTAQITKPTVAVLDFEGRGISKQETATLTDRLISELGNTNAVTLVERKLLDKILEEQGLQQSGCVTEECVAEVGALLGVQFMISGSINKIGKVFTVEAKMFSVETSEAVRTVSKTYRGEIDGLILVIESLAWGIVGMDKQRKVTTAILDFEGRGISNLEAATLTDRFRSELGNTNAVQLVARQEMDEVLDEQGYKQSSECISVECAAEVGALLGVEQIINGSVGKVGNTFTIDAQMVHVGTGATIKTVSQTYRGEVDGLITEIELLAWAIVGLEPPRTLVEKKRISIAQGGRVAAKTRFGAAVRSLFMPGFGQFYSERKLWGWSWLLSEAVIGGLIYMNYTDYQTSYDDYNKYHTLYSTETSTTLIREYKQKAQDSHRSMETANDMMKNLAMAGGAVWLVNVVHAFITGPKQKAHLGYDRQANVVLSYNQEIQQPYLKLSIALN